ncbi:NupC/NupG family nucleoside CNT transporter [Candidatus Dependentiae bacterium]|nr:NupC/NupG family nucleoside CNT transporter [Candidatus Dependentiae bacterium]
MFSYLIQDARYMSFVGIVSILAIAFLFSKNRRKVTAKLVLSALAMQLFLAFCILRTDTGQSIFSSLAQGFRTLYTFADAGSAFVFGGLANVNGPWGLLFFVKVIPIIIFFGALMAVLFHFGVVQFFVRIISFLIRPVLGTSGAETLCAAANSMMGPTEAPLLVKKYLAKMTESEILLVMISGMATMSGSILAVYGSMGVSMVHLLSASIMSIPGAILISKILLPETKKPETLSVQALKIERDSDNVLDAVATGTTDGMRMAANVAAMLITFISLIALLNYLFGAISSWAFGVSYTLDVIFSKLFSWVAFLIGVPAQDKALAGTLLGQKLAINEFVAYANFVKMELTPRARAILTYALCGFSNFSVIGIQIGGIGALAPQQRKNLIKLGLRALLGGTLANLLNASIAGLFI